MMLDQESYFCLLGDLLGDALNVYLCETHSVTYVELEEYILGCDADLMSSNALVRDSKDDVTAGLRGELLILLCQEHLRILDFGSEEQRVEYSAIRSASQRLGYLNPFGYLIENMEEHCIYALLKNSTFEVHSLFAKRFIAQIKRLNISIH